MSENNKFTILEKIKVLSRINSEIRRKIKLLYVFRDNVILITNEEKVFCFGLNNKGVLGFGHENNINELTINEELSNKQILDFKNSLCHTIARTRDGKLYSWGHNESGYLGIRREDECIFNAKINIDICCGGFHTLVLTSNKELFAWGDNSWGQIGNRCNENVLKPFKIDEFIGEKVKAISCGLYHSMALTESGCVYSWGDNRSSQLGRDDEISFDNEPKRIEIDIIIEKISCGSKHSLLLSHEKDIYVFGSNKFKQLGFCAKRKNQYKPIKLNHSEKFIEIASHYYYDISVALSENGLYYVWGECGKEGIISEPKKTKFESFEEIFVHYLQVSFKTINKIEECLKNLFKIENKKYETNFRQIKFIASGSYGIVFKVSDIHSEKCFAIKKVPLCDGFENKKDEWMREMKILSKMNSNYVVECYDFWIEKNYHLCLDPNSSINIASDSESSYLDSLLDSKNLHLLHIQMELCYKTLREIIGIVNEELNSKLNEETSIFSYYISSELFKELVECLNYLHKQIPPIIHRDLKPANILISYGRDGRFVKLADFGFAVIHEYNDQSRTQNKGTHKYMAQEVSGKYYGTPVDIYSLGIITKELFNIDANESYHSLYDKRKEIKELIGRMTAFFPDSRPNCDEILAMDLWQTNVKHLVNEKNVELIRGKNSIEESFHLYFIQKKLLNSKISGNKNDSYSRINSRYDSNFDELEMIASGKLSVVYKAIDRKYNQKYAIKMVPINDLKQEALKEIGMLSKLKSERIVKLESFWIESNNHHRNKALIKKLGSCHELFKQNNTLLLHIQMELCYKTLKEIIELNNKELNQKQSKVMSPLGYYISSELFIEILESVDYLHEKNIIHRDLKPSNILISYGTEGRFVKVGDFGLATFHITEEQSHTVLKETVKYAAPEMVQNKSYDTKADIYSLAIIAHELFNIESINESIGNNSCLEAKYSNLFDLIEKMTSIRWNKRPNCDQILSKRNSWNLSLIELMNTEWKLNVKIKSIEESFHKFFIQTKLYSSSLN